ncbi:MAG: CpcT/CpeT family chromophore lyase [Woeseiaceae bacterium]
MNKFKCIVAANVFLSVLLCATAWGQEREYTLMEREIDYLMNLWPGDYDNVEQPALDANVGKTDPANGGHQRVHSFVTSIDMPEVGHDLLFIDEYTGNDESATLRRRLYSLVPDEQEKAILAEAYHVDSADRSDIGASNFTRAPGCDLLIRRDGDAFTGKIQSADCPSANGDRRFGTYEMRLSKHQYRFYDQSLMQHAGGAGDENEDIGWYQLDRARWFACMIDFPREEGGRPVVTQHYIKIHDQGGEFAFRHPDGRDMVLTMRNNWSYGMQRETFVIVVQEGDTSGEALVYAWSSPDADRIGVNPVFLRVQCDMDTPENVEFQHRLRPDS